MAEQDTIAAVSAPVTVDRMVRDLRALGVKRGDTVIAHCAMSRIGWVCGREAAVVQALLRAVGPLGMLVMPAHTGDDSEPSAWQCPPVPQAWFAPIREQMPAYNRRMTASRGVGRIAECLRTWPGARRSAHPQVSWAAKGPGAAWLLRGHTYSRPGFGMGLPLGRLYRRGAKALLIGVGYGNCTALHLAETLCETTPRETLGAAVSVWGRRRWVTWQDIQMDADRFPALGEAYEQAGGAAATGMLGAAACKLVPIRPLVDFGVRWLREHPAPAEAAAAQGDSGEP